MTTDQRLSTGIDGLDELLGGGLLPGTLAAVVGSTGIGKTQLGLQFAQAGGRQEKHRGIIFDMCARGNSQSHADYARRMFGWELQSVDPEQALDLEHFFSSTLPCWRLPARVRPARAAALPGPTWISTPGTNGRPSWAAGSRPQSLSSTPILFAACAGR